MWSWVITTLEWHYIDKDNVKSKNRHVGSGERMIFKQIKAEGIAHFSYFVGSGNKAFVVDPRRDVGIYLELANEYNMKITHIFETHRNEDYVIGSLELAERTGARILHGKQMDFAYGEGIGQGDEFEIGQLKLETLHTPGHTMESISIVLRDLAVSPLPYLVFTGDALFSGDVGRTDFFGPEKTPEVSGLLYDSIHGKLLPLGDGVLVYPAHGAGSVCGGGISEHEVTTIGYEKKNNPMVALSKKAFVRRKTKEKHTMPPYFEMMEKLNKIGAPILGNLPHPNSLDIQEVKSHRDGGAQIIDTRAPEAFAGGHIRGSISIMRDMVPVFAGWVLDYKKPIIIVEDHTPHLDEVVRHLIRLGYDNIEGYMAGGFMNWYKGAMETEKFNLWTVVELEEHMGSDDIFLLDVRDEESFSEGHIKGAVNIYAGHVKGNLEKIPKDKHVVVYCDSGVKTSMVASILKAGGYEEITNVLGGFIAWKRSGNKVVK